MNNTAFHEASTVLYDKSGLEDENIEPPSIYEVAKVTFRDFIITIYTDSDSIMRVQRRFFFEPIVLMDTKSITHISDELRNRDYVRFTIQMWNEEVRSTIQARLRSMRRFKGVDIQEEDIYVMPFKEVRLMSKADSSITSEITSIRLLDEATCYLQPSQSLEFYFDCDSPSVAAGLVNSFRKNPKMIVKDLELKCYGLALGNGLNGMPHFTFSCKAPLFYSEGTIYIWFLIFRF